MICFSFVEHFFVSSVYSIITDTDKNPLSPCHQIIHNFEGYFNTKALLVTREQMARQKVITVKTKQPNILPSKNTAGALV